MPSYADMVMKARMAVARKAIVDALRTIEAENPAHGILTDALKNFELTESPDMTADVSESVDGEPPMPAEISADPPQTGNYGVESSPPQSETTNVIPQQPANTLAAPAPSDRTVPGVIKTKNPHKMTIG